MARVFIPSLMRDLCHGGSQVEVQGSTLRQVLDNLDTLCPGIKRRILEDGEIRPEFSLAVNGVEESMGLLELVPDGAEVHILPALSGGARP